MADRVDLFDCTYRHFTDQVLDAIRKETFGDDIGQNGWTTVDEYERFLGWLDVSAAHQVLEVGSGSGGPAIHVAKTRGCRVTGIDRNESGVATASQLAAAAGQAERVRFAIADANARLPFDDETFDALLSIDVMNLLPDRLAVLRDWRRVLRAGACAVFTDPTVVSGPVTNDELALRGSIGVVLFVPPGTNEQLISRAGLVLVRQEDVSANAARVAERWHDARDRHRDALIRIEGDERFTGLQRFLATVHRLTSEQRLSRIAYLVQKPA